MLSSMYIYIYLYVISNPFLIGMKMSESSNSGIYNLFDFLQEDSKLPFAANPPIAGIVARCGFKCCPPPKKKLT